MIIRDVYLIKKWLGNGKFGMVYLAEDMTNGEQLAIKTEAINTEYSSIKHEVRMMNYLFQHGFRDLPKIHWYGIEHELTYLAMCYFDRSLENIHSTFIDNTNPHQILGKIMVQCIYILDSLHELFVIHRDIKPQNFMIKNHKIYLIDYGLATFYVDEDGEHLPNKHQESIIGTPKFLSYYNYFGNTLSRRDDLISLGYLYIYLLKGSLPWQNNPDVITLKSLENIHHIHDYAPLKEYMNYCYRLEYDEDPDYEFLCKLFMDTFV